MRAKKRNKKILSLLIATLMIISMLPSSVFAATDDVMIEEYADVVTEEADVVDDVADEAAEVPDVAEQEVEADLAGASEVVSTTAEGLLSGGKMTFDAVLDGVSVSAAVPASRAPQGSVMTVDLVDVVDYADAIAAKIYGKDVSAVKGLELHFYNKKGKEITHINTSDVTITADAMDADSYALCRLNGNSVGVVKKADASAFTFKEKKAYTYAIVGLVDDGVLRATAETGSNGVKSFNLDNIEVIAPEDAFGDDVAMEASDVTGDAATEEEALVGSSEDEVIAAYEISFYDEDGVEQQPEKEVTVKIATALDMSKNYKLIHIADNGETNEVENAVFTESGVEFVTDSFSVYEVVKATEQDAGAVIKMRAVGNTKAAPEISASKNLTDEDKDGIYELALSVTGSAEQSTETHVDKSNVVIVIDTSGSMKTDISDQRISYTYDSSTYQKGNTYQAYINGQWRDLSLNNSGQWTYTRNGQTYIYTGNDVYWSVSNRMDATKAAAYNLVDTLLSNNKTGTTADGTRLDDIVEISLVSFAGTSNNNSDGYLRIYSGSHTDASEIKTWIRQRSATGGTNWEMALKTAKTQADAYSSQTDETTSVIFLTDGMPTFYGNNDAGSGQEQRANVHTCWEKAADDAKDIVDADYTFYSIFAFGSNDVAFYYDDGRTPADYLRSLTNYAYDGDDDPSEDYTNTAKTYDDTYFFDASDTEKLVKAFESIASTITNNVGFGGVEVDDGVTLGVTNTSVTVNGSVNQSSFNYTVTDETGATVYTVKFTDNGTATFTAGGETETDNTPERVVTKIDPDDEDTWITSNVYSVEIGGKTYAMTPATVNTETGMIEWDLAGLGILQNGYTYTLTFDVWPNQWAYDLVADINNGIITKEEALDSIEDPVKRAQVEQALVDNGDGTYAIYTNYHQRVTYYQADEETTDDGTPTTTYGQQQYKDLEQPDAVKLTSSKMDLRKLWEDELDESQYEKLLYNEDGSSKELTLVLKVWKADTLSDLNRLVETDADGTEYKKVTLGWNADEEKYIWSDTLNVAPGLMILLSKAKDMGIDTSDTTRHVTYDGNEYFILESGHYYFVTEVDSDYHFDLVTVVYHPMLVDGVLSNVTFNEDGTVEDIEPMSMIDATNTLRGGINLKKVVLDPDGDEYPTDDKFTFTVVLNNEKEVFTGEDIPWYGVNGMYYHDADGNFIPSTVTGDTDGDGLDDDGNIPVVSNNNKTATYTFEIDSTDEIRINNVPIDTTYTVTETQTEGFELDSVVTTVGVGSTVESEETTYDLVTNGEIVPNRENNITYKNKMTSFPAFYVYHSSDKTIEKIFADDERVTKAVNEETGLMELTGFNIAAETKENTLYGGYFKAYKGSGMTDAQIIAAAYENTDSAGYAYTTKEESTSNWATDSSGKAYDGATAGQWVKKNAYTENGLAMNPAVNTVYYLKEVPSQYFRPALYYVYDDVSPEKDIKKLYFMVPTDDNLYQLVCGRPIDLTENKKLYGTFKVTNADGSEKAIAIKDVNSNLKRGYLTVWDGASFMVEKTEYEWIPNFVTLDSVEVTSYVERVINTGDLCYGEKASNFKTTDSKIDSSVATYSKP